MRWQWRVFSEPCVTLCSVLQDYVPVEQEELRDYVKARLKVFYEEELDVPLVLFNEVLDHVLRIDRYKETEHTHTRAHAGWLSPDDGQ